jgi:regulator of protease activity HflC (stomatin/prohibitin superfamily)
LALVDLVPWLVPLILLAIMILASAIKIVKEYERGVIFRLGRLVGARGPGLFFIIPIFEAMVKLDLRTTVLDVPSQEVITRDNVPVRVDAVVYFRVMDPEKSIVQVTNYVAATSLYSQTTMRTVIGQATLDEVLSEREKLNKELQRIIDEATDPWGIKVSAVELKNVEVPEAMKRAMARQAEAERDRRGRVIAAQGEMQAAMQLAEAAKTLQTSEGALQLRLLGSLSEAAQEKANTIIVPIPVELLSALRR